MTGKGHTWVSLVFSIATYKMGTQIGLTGIDPVLVSIGTILGGTAPDWMEIRKSNGGTVIRHRTITHWLPLWLCAFFFVLGILTKNSNLYDIWNFDIISSHFWAFLFGFSIGGLLHLLVDIPNPMGIPILTPNRRFSLKLWKSGKFEIPIVTAFLLFSLYYIDFLSINIEKLNFL